jgi:hypothetical protein
MERPHIQIPHRDCGDLTARVPEDHDTDADWHPKIQELPSGNRVCLIMPQTRSLLSVSPIILNLLLVMTTSMTKSYWWDKGMGDM